MSSYANDAIAMRQILRFWLLHNLAKHVDDEAVKKRMQRCSSKVERPNEPVGSDGLLQPWLGETAEFCQPRIQQ
jgi:hypothetical protein